jgi:hypothetical protein
MECLDFEDLPSELVSSHEFHPVISFGDDRYIQIFSKDDITSQFPSQIQQSSPPITNNPVIQFWKQPFKKGDAKTSLPRNYPPVTETISGHPFIPIYGPNFMNIDYKTDQERFSHSQLSELCSILNLSVSKNIPKSAIIKKIQLYHKERIRKASNPERKDVDEVTFLEQYEDEGGHDVTKWTGYGKHLFFFFVNKY